MKIFYVTFGQKSPFRDNWVEVLAENEQQARDKIFYIFGPYWSFMYSDDNFNMSMFPDGKVGKTIE